MKPIPSLLLALFTAVAGFAADSPAADPAARQAEVRTLIASLKPQTGNIELGSDIARASLPPQLAYLSPADTATVLEKVWGNPKGGHSLGMVVPANFDPLDASTWAVVISYENDGYVKDDDAAHINYDKMLAEMKESTIEGNKSRVKEGYEPIQIVGWASPPRYDAVSKKLYWAKEIKFGDSTENTLNYNLRLLGRNGVLVLNAIAGMDQLKQVEAATPAILAAVNFQPGNRYADFKPGTDKVATYGIAALVAGGVAAKAGLFKGLLVAILALKKFLIIGVIALVAGIKRFWAWLNGRKAAAAAEAALPPTQG
jgi:uncharacterized membrane-anchored protein